MNSTKMCLCIEILFWWTWFPLEVSVDGSAKYLDQSVHQKWLFWSRLVLIKIFISCVMTHPKQRKYWRQTAADSNEVTTQCHSTPICFKKLGVSGFFFEYFIKISEFNLIYQFWFYNFKIYPTIKINFLTHPGVRATDSNQFEIICDLCKPSQFMQKFL